MNAPSIIAKARTQGVMLTADTKRIIAKPTTRLTPELREAIPSHSAELLKVLTHDHRCARFDSDIGTLRHEVDLRRRAPGVPRAIRQHDRRTAPSHPSTQGSTTEELKTIEPARLCSDCGSGQWWQLPGQLWHCRACAPDMPLTATTLTSVMP